MTPAEVPNYLKYVQKVTARARPQLYQRLDGGALPPKGKFYIYRQVLDCSPTNRERELGLDRRETG